MITLANPRVAEQELGAPVGSPDGDPDDVARWSRWLDEYTVALAGQRAVLGAVAAGEGSAEPLEVPLFDIPDDAPDVPPVLRDRARMLLGETQRLAQLAQDIAAVLAPSLPRPSAEPSGERVDRVI